MSVPVQMILVPKGAEHQAICRGLRGVLYPPTVFPVPVGVAPLAQYLDSLHQAGCFYPGQTVLMMGLCGGLSPQLAVGDAVLYQECVAARDALDAKSYSCDRALTETLQAKLGNQTTLVKAVTSDRVISAISDKQKLFQQFHTEVVDMEGTTAIERLTQFGVAVATLRVVSDDCHHPIPNLENVFSPSGSLRPVPLAISMARQPIAAYYLIRGSTQGLKILQNLTVSLFN